MKFIISTQELNYLINKIQNVVPLKQTIPILSNFLIEAANGKLTLTATDLTVGVECSTELEHILEEGAITLPAKRFSQLIRELTATNLEFKCSSNEIVEITAGASHFKINGMNKAEFPALPNLDDAIQFSIPQKELKELLAATAFAASREENRPILTGICMQINNGKATFTTTDGKRLAQAQSPIAIDPAMASCSVIPLKAVEEISKNLSDDEEDATIYIMQDKLAVNASNTRVITKLLVGDYPDVNKVIPEKLDITISLHREELMSLLRQMSLFTSIEKHSVHFNFRHGELNLMSNNTDLGEGKVSMPLDYQGADLDIAFNPHYFLDILRHCQGETISLGLIDTYNPGIITNQASQKDGPLYMLMPLRLE